MSVSPVADEDDERTRVEGCAQVWEDQRGDGPRTSRRDEMTGDLNKRSSRGEGCSFRPRGQHGAERQRLVLTVPEHTVTFSNNNISFGCSHFAQHLDLNEHQHGSRPVMEKSDGTVRV